MCNKYNGWENYPTWNVHLWLSNDEGSYDEARRIVKEARCEYDAAQALKAWIEEMYDEWVSHASMGGDIFGWALSMVNWQDVAEAFKDEENNDV